jgi:hypothetical protein
MPVIHSYYEARAGHPADAELIRFWVESWSRRGWTPRLLTLSDTVLSANEPDPFIRAMHALMAVGGGVFSHWDIVNYGFTASMRPPPGMFVGAPDFRVLRMPPRGLPLNRMRRIGAVYTFGEPGWEHAKLVKFGSRDDIVSCGRPF